MALRNAIFEDESKQPILGMDSTSPLSALTNKPGWVRAAYNCRFGYSSGIRMRGGFSSNLLTAWDSKAITAAVQYQTPLGVREIVVYGVDTAGALGRRSSGAISLITDTDPDSQPLGTTRPSLVQVDSRLFAFFGSANAPLLYDGTTTRQVGISRPTTSPSLASSDSTGSLVSGAPYLVAYTFYNANTKAESSPSELASIELGSSDNTITVSNIEGGDSETATHVRLWRSVAGGLNLYLEKEVAIGTTSTTLTLPDAQLSSLQLELDNSRITDFTSSPQYAIVVNNRIFVKSGKNEIRYSKIGQTGPMPESFEVKGFVVAEGTFGQADDIIGLSAAGDTVVVLKERSVGILEPIGIADQRFSSDPVIYRYREVVKNVHPVGHWSAQPVGRECLLLTQDNIGALDERGQWREVASNIRNNIQSCGFSAAQREQLTSIVDTQHRVVMFSCFPSVSASRPAITFVGDFQRTDPNTGRPFFRWSIDTPDFLFEFAFRGYAPGCFFTAINSISGKPEVFFGNYAGDGQYYKLYDSAFDEFDGHPHPIFFKIVTRPYDFNEPYVEKLHKGLALTALEEGSGGQLQAGALFSLTEPEAGAAGIPPTPAEITQTLQLDSSNVATWDTALWDTDRWPIQSNRELEFSVHRRSRYVQYVFTYFNTVYTTSPSFILNSWTAIASRQRYA